MASDVALVRAAIRGWHGGKFPDENLTGKAFMAALAAYREAQLATPNDCPIGSCQRWGRCMYLNHPRCPLCIAEVG